MPPLSEGYQGSCQSSELAGCGAVQAAVGWEMGAGARGCLWCLSLCAWIAAAP